MPIPQRHVQGPWKAMVLLGLVWALTACVDETPKDSSENTEPPTENTGKNPAGNTPYTVIQIAAGRYHSCALLNTGQMKCWGYNSYGQLGLGDTNSRGDAGGKMGNNLPMVALGTASDGTIFHATAIAAGFVRSCALLHTKQVKCWGWNNMGQLGLGDTNNRGDAGGEMGNNLPLVALGTASDGTPLSATAIEAGDGHSCVLFNTGQIKCWGNNSSGQLGLGDTNNRGDAGGEMGNNLPLVALGTASNGTTFHATAIATGIWHSCALLHTKQVKCWGGNSSGQLGLGDTNNRGDDQPGGVSEMGNNLPMVALGTASDGTIFHATAIATGIWHSCALLHTKQVKCWGYHGNGQIGTPMSLGTASDGTALRAIAITAGYYHNCVLFHTDQVKCWGWNNMGQLGLGNTTQQNAPVNTPVNLGTASDGTALRAIAIAAGAEHSCALLHTKQMKCWGGNRSGELGIENRDDRGYKPSQMGNSLPTVDLGTYLSTK